MDTRTDEIAGGIYRFSTWLPEIAPPDGFCMCQFLVMADEPLLYHCGPRAMFPLVAEAVSRVLPLARLRWISFGHVEADECGAMNQWLAAAPEAQVVYGALGCELSVSDMADRPPRPMPDGETLDLGGRRLRFIATPHVPHGWEAQVVHEEGSGTLFCGDILSHTGNGPALTSADLVEPAIATEEMFQATSLGPATAPTLRKLADLSPRTLAVMHGSSFAGDGATALRRMADYYEHRLRTLLS